MIFSKTLPKQGSNDIGRYELGSCLSPPLNRGVTFAVLKHFGKIAFSKQILNNLTRYGAMIKLVSFSTRLKIESKPHDFLGSRFFNISNSSAESVLDRKKQMLE